MAHHEGKSADKQAEGSSTPWTCDKKKPEKTT